MAFTLGQHKAAAQASTAQSLAFTSNVTAGNLLIVGSFGYAVSLTLSVGITNSGTAGVQTWHPLLTAPYSSTSASDTSDMWWARASGTGTCTVTLTWSGGGSGEMFLAEFSGTSISAALVQNGTGQSAQGTGTTVTTPSLTTTYTDDLIIGLFSTNGTPTVVSPWLAIDSVAGVGALYYRAGVAAGTYTPNITQASGTYANSLGAMGIPPVGGVIPRRTLMGVGV